MTEKKVSNTTKWQKDELEKIGSKEEIKLVASKKDGTFFNPVTIWIVQVDNELYVRSYRGSNGSWYKHVQLNSKGRVSAGKITKDVNFIILNDEDKPLNDKIDQEYRSKYQKYGKSYVEPMISPQSRATTVKINPL